MAKTVLNINSQEQILADFDSYDRYKKSCQDILYDKQIWKEAEFSNTRVSYEYYLQNFPSGFYIDEAKKRIIKINSEDNKSWERAKKENKKYSYENYLKDYPEGLNAQEAKTRIMDINAWERAKSYNTKNSYEEYLENYPKGLFKVEAKKIVDEHETWETAKASNSKSLYREYLRKYPNGIYSYQANTLIAQILAKEKEDFWTAVKYISIAAVIVFISYAVNKEKPINNQQPVTYNQPITPTPAVPVQTQPETLYVNTQQMILRTGAGAEYGEISKIPYGDAVIATETAVSADGGNWVKVKTGNLDGWLNKKYLSINKPTSENDSQGISLTAIQNASYSILNSDTEYSPDKIKLSNGEWSKPIPDSSIMEESVSIYDNQFAFGDLDGDGDNDAAVILGYSGGGSGSFAQVAAILNQGDHIEHIASRMLGDRVEIQKFSISNGSITIELSSSRFFPGKNATLKYTLSGNKLIGQASPFM